MWDSLPVTERHIEGLVLLIVAVLGLVRPRYQPHQPLLASQRWGYSDVIIVFAVIAALDFLPPLPASGVSGVWGSAIESGSRAFLAGASVWVVVRRKHRRPWQALGFDPATALRNALWSLRIGLGIFSVFAVFVLVVRLNAPETPNPSSGVPSEVWRGQLGGVVAASIVLTVLGPLAEELAFRGVLYGPLLRRFGAVGATIATAALWAGVHYSGPSFWTVGKILFVLGLGITYAEVYRRRQSLIPTVVFHIISNAPAVLIRDRPLVFLLPVVCVSLVLWIASAVWLQWAVRSEATTDTAVRSG